MVTVAQLVESRIVIPVVAGSSPVGHPKFQARIISLCGLFSFAPIYTYSNTYLPSLKTPHDYL